MPRVLNFYRDGLPAGAIDCRRPGPWGNPHRIGLGVSRLDAVLAHRQMVLQSPSLRAAIKRELRGKDLVCVCKPKVCHCDVLLEIANE